MAKKDVIELEGTVVEALPNAREWTWNIMSYIWKAKNELHKNSRRW